MNNRNNYKDYKNQPRKQPSNLIYGVHPIMEALKTGRDIEKVLISREDSQYQIREAIEICRDRKIPIQKVPIEKLNSLVRSNHQGIIAFMSLIEYQPMEDVLISAFQAGEQPFVLILDRVTDVRNFGAIIRTAECVGVHCVIIPDKGSASINADAIKTSSGALNRVPISRSSNLKTTLNYLKQSGVEIVGVTEYAKEIYYKTSLDKPIALILGSEEDGISKDLLKMCDKLIKIPLKGEITSLNVSVAAGIVMYEALKQRGN